MCSVSMVGDFYSDKWRERDYFPKVPMFPGVFPQPQYPIPVISREEFDLLKREVSDMKELLKRAKEYDEKNGEPNCEIDEKIDLLRKVAKLVGVDLGDILAPPK